MENRKALIGLNRIDDVRKGKADSFPGPCCKARDAAIVTKRGALALRDNPHREAFLMVRAVGSPARIDVDHSWAFTPPV